ncbi:MAG: SPOR domain-containing protein [Myxococcota bacterium]
MQSHWRAFGIGFAFGLGYLCIPSSQHSPSGPQCQRVQWLKELRYHTSFSFPQQLLQSPVKTERQTHDRPERSVVGPSFVAPTSPSAHHEGLRANNLLQALQKALGKTAPESVKHWQSTAPLSSSTGSPWAIQVATRASRELAEKLQQQLIAKGHDARVVQGYNPHSYEIEYHIRLHGFATQSQAQKYREKFKKKERGFSSFCLQQPSSKHIP